MIKLKYVYNIKRIDSQTSFCIFMNNSIFMKQFGMSWMFSDFIIAASLFFLFCVLSAIREGLHTRLPNY